MFSGKTYKKTVYLSFSCYFPCLGQNHWSLPAVMSDIFAYNIRPKSRVRNLPKIVSNLWWPRGPEAMHFGGTCDMWPTVTLLGPRQFRGRLFNLVTSMTGLTASQQQALTQLQTITNGEYDVAKSVLESVDWDVQVSLTYSLPSPQLTLLTNRERPSWYSTPHLLRVRQWPLGLRALADESRA